MLSHVVLPNGQPIRVRLDSGLPFDTCERARLLEEPAPSDTSKSDVRGPLCVLGSATVVFLLLSLALLVIVLFTWSEVRRVSDLAQAAFPSTHELSAFVRAIMNSTSHTVQNVEQMSSMSNTLLDDSARTIRVTLNATQDMVRAAGNVIAHPPSLQLGIGRSV